MHRIYLGVFLVLAGLVLLAINALAQEHRLPEPHAGHAQHHDVYREWIIPGSQTANNPNGMPCCNAKYDTAGNLLGGGDCYHTIAEPRPSADPELEGRLVWWARRDDGVWIEVPKRRMLNELNPDETGTRAHLCENMSMGGGVLCFLPPTGGS